MSGVKANAIAKLVREYGTTLEENEGVSTSVSVLVELVATHIEEKVIDAAVLLETFTAPEIEAMRSGLLSDTYWESPEQFRDDGFPQEPDDDDESDDAREQRERLVEYDRLDAKLVALLTASRAPTPTENERDVLRAESETLSAMVAARDAEIAKLRAENSSLIGRWYGDVASGDLPPHRAHERVRAGARGARAHRQEGRADAMSTRDDRAWDLMTKQLEQAHEERKQLEDTLQSAIRHADTLSSYLRDARESARESDVRASRSEEDLRAQLRESEEALRKLRNEMLEGVDGKREREIRSLLTEAIIATGKHTRLESGITKILAAAGPGVPSDVRAALTELVAKNAIDPALNLRLRAFDVKLEAGTSRRERPGSAVYLVRPSRSNPDHWCVVPHATLTRFDPKLVLVPTFELASWELLRAPKLDSNTLEHLASLPVSPRGDTEREPVGAPPTVAEKPAEPPPAPPAAPAPAKPAREPVVVRHERSVRSAHGGNLVSVFAVAFDGERWILWNPSGAGTRTQPTWYYLREERIEPEARPGRLTDWQYARLLELADREGFDVSTPEEVPPEPNTEHPVPGQLRVLARGFAGDGFDPVREVYVVEQSPTGSWRCWDPVSGEFETISDTKLRRRWVGSKAVELDPERLGPLAEAFPARSMHPAPVIPLEPKQTRRTPHGKVVVLVEPDGPLPKWLPGYWIWDGHELQLHESTDMASWPLVAPFIAETEFAALRELVALRKNAKILLPRQLRLAPAGAIGPAPTEVVVVAPVAMSNPPAWHVVEPGQPRYTTHMVPVRDLALWTLIHSVGVSEAEFFARVDDAMDLNASMTLARGEVRIDPEKGDSHYHLIAPSGKRATRWIVACVRQVVSLGNKPVPDYEATWRWVRASVLATWAKSRRTGLTLAPEVAEAAREQARELDMMWGDFDATITRPFPYPDESGTP